MTEVKISKKAMEYLKKEDYKTIIVTLEKTSSCVGSNITGLGVELLKNNEILKEGYNYIEADKISLLVDKKLVCRSVVSIHLNEGKIGNIFDIEGIEL